MLRTLAPSMANPFVRLASLCSCHPAWGLSIRFRPAGFRLLPVWPCLPAGTPPSMPRPQMLPRARGRQHLRLEHTGGIIFPLQRRSSDFRTVGWVGTLFGKMWSKRGNASPAGPTCCIASSSVVSLDQKEPVPPRRPVSVEQSENGFSAARRCFVSVAFVSNRSLHRVAHSVWEVQQQVDGSVFLKRWKRVFLVTTSPLGACF